MDLFNIRCKVNNVARDARNLARVVDGEAFARAWEKASSVQREELAAYITGIDKDKVSGWVKRVLASMSLEDKPIRELRALAKAAGVDYVNNRQKDELIERLKP